MDWHDWIRKHKNTMLEVARDYVSTVDFENERGMSCKSYYRSSDIPDIPAGKVMIVMHYFEDIPLSENETP